MKPGSCGFPSGKASTDGCPAGAGQLLSPNYAWRDPASKVRGDSPAWLGSPPSFSASGHRAPILNTLVSLSYDPPRPGGLGARASRPHPVPLAAAELPCDAAGSHPVGGNRSGQAEGEPWRRSRLIQVGEMAQAVPGLVRAGRPRSQQAFSLNTPPPGRLSATRKRLDRPGRPGRTRWPDTPRTDPHSG